MSKSNDSTKSEAWENLVALGATLAAVEPLTGAAMMLAGKVPGWWARRAAARATTWWSAFLEECRSDPSVDLSDMRARIEQQMESSPETADVIMGHMRDVLDTVTSEAVAILGSLRGAYYAKQSKPDGFFRGATELLMQCTEADIEALRVLTGRIACIVPTTTTKTIALKSHRHPDTGVRKYSVDQVELENVGGATTSLGVLGVAWEVDPLWKRLPHLLVSTGLARNDAQLYDFIVEQPEMARLHQLIRRRGIALGTYRYYRDGSSNSRAAELAEIPSCFGYGETAEAAFDMMKTNLTLFVDDWATATLAKAPRP